MEQRRSSTYGAKMTSEGRKPPSHQRRLAKCFMPMRGKQSLVLSHPNFWQPYRLVHHRISRRCRTAIPQGHAAPYFPLFANAALPPNTPKTDSGLVACCKHW